MSNPFPGVNPFIESEGFWRDFHESFIPELRVALLAQLPDRYDARIEVRLELIDPGMADDVRIPDLTIVESADARGGATSAALAVAKPTTLKFVDQDEKGESLIQVIDMNSDAVVTSIELLSPTNKAEGFQSFHGKRRALLASGTNVVDIDLLLHGRRPRFERPLPAGHFFAFVTRQQRAPQSDIFAWGLTRPLPVIPIPLLPSDPDVTIDLQEVYRTNYIRGQYGLRRLNYRAPLHSGNASLDDWAASIVAASKR